MSEKYLRKNEFKYCTSREVLRKDGKGHVVYITAEHGNMVKGNVITHGRYFFTKRTYDLQQNPKINNPDKRPSYFSIPHWFKKTTMKRPYGVWHMYNQDRRNIHRANRAYERRRKKR